LLRPVLGAGVCFLLFQVALFFLIPVVQFFGGEMVALTVPMLLGSAVASALAMAIFEARSLGDTGLTWGEGTSRNLLTGIGLGAAGALLVIVPALAGGLARFAAVSNADISWRADLFLPMLLFCGAMGEEIAFRGFILQILMRGWGSWIAIVLIGTLFGMLHKDNPGATPLAVANTAAFGILFGFSVLRSHDLWFPIGLHFGWNAALPFLGVELSGLTIRVAGYELVWKSGDLWSGGKYGPEASVITSAVLAILFLLVWKVPVHRSRLYFLDDSEAPATQPAL
jgi:membrane protease YdiL (CAAX protease family)